MQPLRKGLAAGVLLALVLSAPAREADDDTLDKARREALRELLHQDCGSCHGLHLDGGLGPPLTPERMRRFDREALTRIILDGVPDTAMPAWRSQLSEAEARWLARHLRNREPSNED